jgi:hypothetical protein
MEPAEEASLEPSGDAVKEPAGPIGAQLERPRFGRLFSLFEGWELGAITVGLVLCTALLAVPRAAPPGLFPVPLVDPAEAREARLETDALADAAERDGLPFETRAVGDAVRRFGVALSGGTGDLEHLNRLIVERVQMALRADQAEALRRLRAVQTRLFLRAVHAQNWSAPPSSELKALGGDFAARAQRSGWVTGEQSRATDDELESLFARRWSELTHLRDHPRFKASLGELRRYYRFLLLHPERGTESGDDAAERAALRLRYVEALAKRDTEYPLQLARGSLLAELGRMPESAQALSDYLSHQDAASFNLRARNYLLYAAQGQTDDELEDEP